VGGGDMASTEREPITGVWGGAPAGSRGRAPGQGARGASPPEAESFLTFGHQTETITFVFLLYFANSGCLIAATQYNVYCQDLTKFNIRQILNVSAIK